MEQKNRKKYHRGPRKGRSKNGQQKGSLVSTIVLIIAVIVFVISAIQLVLNFMPYFKGGAEYDEIKELAINGDEEDKEGEFSVDFNALRQINPDTIAWIRFDEPAVISYPVVKSADNEEYLTRTFQANDNKLGAIFMDMDNNSEFQDRNTFIYGHNLQVGGEMFSQLSEYASEDFCKQYPNFYIYTPDGRKHTYRIFSAGVVKDDAENYIKTYASDEEFARYIETLRASSNYTVDVEVTTSSKIVTLSTCTNVAEDERFIVHGVLAGAE